MGEDVKGRKDWKFIKGINDVGQEQTYMTLASKTDGGRFAYDPFNFADDEFLGLLWEKAYLVALFGPFVITVIYCVTNLI